MNRRHYWLAAATLSVVIYSGAASAQSSWGNYYIGPGGMLADSGQPVEPQNTYVQIQNNHSCAIDSNTCVAFIPLAAFGGGSSPSLRAEIDTLNSQMSRAFELIAVAAAMKDAIPNAGDRFAIRINAAAFNGQAAGAFGVSYNITDSARLSLNYGQGASRAIVSGGLNLSFR
jgi:hypothetical protein